tara:strand:+ start:809 stop:1030 length:222 start_codon:yes stop_codon:yes gene_type:complete
MKHIKCYDHNNQLLEHCFDEKANKYYTPGLSVTWEPKYITTQPPGNPAEYKPKITVIKEEDQSNEEPDSSGSN